MLDVVPVLHSMAAEDADAAAAEMFAAIGDIGAWRPWDQWVIGATYHRPTVTRGGIELVQTRGSTTHNDQLLGKAFLLVAYGPSAFPDNLLPLFGGKRPEIGSWFFAMARDGTEISLQFPNATNDNRLKRYGWPCRAFMAKDLMGPIPHPGCIV